MTHRWSIAGGLVLFLFSRFWNFSLPQACNSKMFEPSQRLLSAGDVVSIFWLEIYVGSHTNIRQTPQHMSTGELKIELPFSVSTQVSYVSLYIYKICTPLQEVCEYSPFVFYWVFPSRLGEIKNKNYFGPKFLQIWFSLNNLLQILFNMKKKY